MKVKNNRKYIAPAMSVYNVKVESTLLTTSSTFETFVEEEDWDA